MTQLLHLSHGDARLGLAASTGGAITAFTWRGIPILRTTPPEVIAEGDVRRHACYPLVPYSNRIAHGHLVYAGKSHQLARNFSNHPHAIHGVGWQRPWQVLAHDTTSALLAYDHAPASASHAGDPDGRAWPWPFRATQWFQLAAAAAPGGVALRIRMALTNTGGEAFPFGLGWHPFFPRNAQTVLGFTANGVWETDDTILPTVRAPVGGEFRFDPPRRIGGTALDNVYTQWPGEAELRYPDQGYAVRLRGDSASPFFVVHIPLHGEFLAIEPVTQMTDAFNRAARGDADTGTRELNPEESFSCTMEISAGPLP